MAILKSTQPYLFNVVPASTRFGKKVRRLLNKKFNAVNDRCLFEAVVRLETNWHVLLCTLPIWPIWLNGRGFALLRDAAILFLYRWHNTIHQAISIYLHWVILGMELEYQALGTRQQMNYKITYICIYTQQNTVPRTHKSN